MNTTFKRVIAGAAVAAALSGAGVGVTAGIAAAGPPNPCGWSPCPSPPPPTINPGALINPNLGDLGNLGGFRKPLPTPPPLPGR